MRALLGVFICLAAMVIAASASAKRTADTSPVRYMSSPSPEPLPAELRSKAEGPSLSAAVVADTFHLAWYSFGGGSGPDPQGWVRVDLTAQLDTFFHVADATELDGGNSGKLIVIQGTQSMWCGVDVRSAAPYCNYATLPGYGSGWNQILLSRELDCDSVRIYYEICWDSEPGYDATRLQYYDENTQSWVNLPVNGGATGGYDGTGNLTECFAFVVPNANTLPQPGGGAAGSTRLRFEFISDGAYSDQDGFFPSDGACLIDSITIECYDWYLDADSTMVDSLKSTYFSDFEPGSAGAAGPANHGDDHWQGVVPTPYGQFGDLYPGTGGNGYFDGRPHAGLQEDECVTVSSSVWAWIDHFNNANYSCHTPNPEPLQGVVPFGPDANGFYLDNEIWSPRIPVAGTSGTDWRLSFLIYRDLPLDNLVYYTYQVRSWIGGCPGVWRALSFIYIGGSRDWSRIEAWVGSLVEPGVEEIQLSIGVVDLCGAWCSIFGTGSCHSHSPLIDEVHLKRIDSNGPQFRVRHLDLFQDNFPDISGSGAGHARADAANDILPGTRPDILPGDSVAIDVSDPDVGIATDPFTGTGSALYMYVAVWPQVQAGKSGPELEAPETLGDAYPGAVRGGGKRFPLVDSLLHDGTWWYCLRADTAFTAGGGVVNAGERHCFDLNDGVFTAGDTICYVFCAENTVGERTYFSRRLNGNGLDFVTDDLWEALASPLEFQILPGGGWKAGGDILYVDDADDRSGPPQLFFDTAFRNLGIARLVDRYDVLSPSSNVGNGLGSRVKDIATQISDCYQKIIWCSGNLFSALGDGGYPNGGSGPEKSDSWAVIFQHLNQRQNNPGVYLSGDDLAQEWISLTGASAIAARTTYMDFALGGSSPGNHLASGEPLSPCLVASGPCFMHLGVPDSLVAYGGCPVLNDFDLLIPLSGQVEFANPTSGAGYVISQTTPNAVADTARVILSGFSYHYIRNKTAGFPDARTEHLADIIAWLENDRPEATGVGGRLLYESFLAHNYPNPFNPSTTIRYGVRQRTHVSLRIYNVAGQLVRTLVDEVKAPVAGGHNVTWDGRSNAGEPVSSGVYFYKLVTREFVQARKMILLK